MVASFGSQVVSARASRRLRGATTARHADAAATVSAGPAQPATRRGEGSFGATQNRRFRRIGLAGICRPAADSGEPPPVSVVLVAIAIIVVIIAVRWGQSVSSVIATVLVVVVLPAAGGILGRLWFPSLLGAGSSSGVAGSPDGGQPSTQGGPPGGSTPASGYTWAQLSHDYPGLRTPCTKQPNAAGRLQCYWSHYSNVGPAQLSAKQPPRARFATTV